jgi:4'-phosphopantetheinyl transferase
MRTLTASDFIPVAFPQEFAPGEIHLWLFTQCRGSGFPRADQDRSLRELLGAYLCVDANALRFERDTFGKPFLVGLPTPRTLQFNLSHTAHFLLIGISCEQRLGVDLETEQRRRPWLELARRYFSDAEFVALTALAEDQRGRSFLDLWSCKEAVLKALGRGIAFGLHRLAFSLDGRGSVDALADIDEEAGVLAEWHIVRLAPESGLCGALAWHGAARNVRAFRMNISTCEAEVTERPPISCDAPAG